MAGQGAPLLGLPQPHGGAEHGLASGMEVTGEQSTSGSAVGRAVGGTWARIAWAPPWAGLGVSALSPPPTLVQLPSLFSGAGFLPPFRDGAWDKLAGTETSITL